MITRRLTSLLLLSTALSVPTLAYGQEPTAPAAPPAASSEETDVSLPGVDEIVVMGQRANVVRATSQVVSVLSTQELARSGEGNIAGALTRLTGISLVGGGYVYVRGL